ncbi:hypothetical protein EV421DRAFT_1908324 [Armillaria borealis]|uniref:Uncharacterized protein n=1 Tax=Armillaria borealis TaxID=47425 RepID=A0AA39J5I3_9AGAR|nr:hypothetical protein EV421DRAFT_1908324 [Armillaria borealis]
MHDLYSEVSTPAADAIGTHPRNSPLPRTSSSLPSRLAHSLANADVDDVTPRPLSVTMHGYRTISLPGSKSPPLPRRDLKPRRRHLPPLQERQVRASGSHFWVQRPSFEVTRGFSCAVELAKADYLMNVIKLLIPPLRVGWMNGNLDSRIKIKTRIRTRYNTTLLNTSLLLIAELHY